MTEIEIGRGKRGRRAYSFDDIAVVPSRRTRDPEEVSVAWQIDAYHFELPVIAAPMDSVISPDTAIALRPARRPAGARPRGPVDPVRRPDRLLAEIAALDPANATRRMQEIYAAPIRAELITERLRQIRDAGVTVAGALSPQRTQEFWKTVVDAGVDLFVIRGTTVSAEHVSSRAEPLNLKRFIYELDVPGHRRRCGHATPRRCTSCAPARPASSSGSAAAPPTPRASPSASTPRWPRRSPTSPRRGATTWTSPAAATCTSSPTAAWAAAARSSRPWPCGADAVMLGAALARATDAPGRGYHWGSEAHHGQLPRGERVEVGALGSLEEILLGPGLGADGTTNLIGALKRAMATTGYSDVKEFQRVEVVVAPYQRS